MIPIAIPIASTTSMSVNAHRAPALYLKPEITQNVLLFFRQTNHLAKPVHDRWVFVANDDFDLFSPAGIANLFVRCDFRLSLPCPPIEWGFKRFRPLARKHLAAHLQLRENRDRQIRRMRI